MANKDLNRDGRLDAQDLLLDRGNLVIDTNFVRIQGTHISRHTGGEHHIIMTDPHYKKLIKLEKPSDRNTLLTKKMIMEGIFSFTDWITGKKMDIPDRDANSIEIDAPESEYNGERFIIRELGDEYRYNKGNQYRWQEPTNKTFRIGKAFYETHVDHDHLGVERPPSQELVNQAQEKIKILSEAIKKQASPKSSVQDEASRAAARIEELLARQNLPTKIEKQLRQSKQRLKKLITSGGNINTKLKSIKDGFNGLIDKNELPNDIFREVQGIQDIIANIFDANMNNMIKEGSQAAQRARKGIDKVATSFGQLATENTKTVKTDKYAFSSNTHENWHFGDKINKLHGNTVTHRVGDKHAYLEGRIKVTLNGGEAPFNLGDLDINEIGQDITNLIPGGNNATDSSLLHPDAPGFQEIPGMFGNKGNPEVVQKTGLDSVSPGELNFKFDTDLPASSEAGILQQKMLNVDPEQNFSIVELNGPEIATVLGNKKTTMGSYKSIRTNAIFTLNGLTITDKEGEFFSDTHGLFSDLSLSEHAVRKNVNMEGKYVTTLGKTKAISVNKVTAKNFAKSRNANFAKSIVRNTNKTSSITGTSISATGTSQSVKMGPAFSLAMANLSTGLTSLSTTGLILTMRDHSFHSNKVYQKATRQWFIMDKLKLGNSKRLNPKAKAWKRLGLKNKGFLKRPGKYGKESWKKLIGTSPKNKILNAATYGKNLAVLPIGGIIVGNMMDNKRDKSITSNPDNSHLRLEDLKEKTTINPSILSEIEAVNTKNEQQFTTDHSPIIEEQNDETTTTTTSATKAGENDRKSKFITAAGVIGTLAAVHGLLGESQKEQEDTTTQPDKTPEIPDEESIEDIDTPMGEIIEDEMMAEESLIEEELNKDAPTEENIIKEENEEIIEDSLMEDDEILPDTSVPSQEENTPLIPESEDYTTEEEPMIMDDDFIITDSLIADPQKPEEKTPPKEPPMITEDENISSQTLIPQDNEIEEKLPLTKNQKGKNK